MNKKVSILAVLTAALSLPLFSQVSVDPSDKFYTMVESWGIRGIINEVPPIRPYPLANVKEILDTVIKNGDAYDTEIANLLYEDIFKHSWHVEAGADYALSQKKENSDPAELDSMLYVYPALEGDFYLFDDFVSVGYHLGWAARNIEDESRFLPIYTNSMHDSIQDSASIGPMNVYLDMNNSLAVGKKNMFMQAGIYRTGYGPYLNQGLALNDSAYHCANLSFTYMNGRLSYAHQLSMIGATSSYSGDSGTLAPDKILAFHALEYGFTDQFSASYYETIVYGNRFDASYLLPVPFMVAQGIGGCNDNLQMGILLKYRPVKGVLWATDIFVDDIDVNKLAKLSIDSKNRIAFKTGLVYTPENSFCTRANLNYTFVTPYTYSHWEYDDEKTASISAGTKNYQNYTNNGINMGTAFAPNSDAINLTLDFRPVSRLGIKVSSTFMRHANVCESLTDDEAFAYLCAEPGVYSTDGSVNTHSMMADSSSSNGTHVDTAWDKLNFLNQEHTMYVIQTGIQAEYTFATRKKTHVSFRAGYTFEYIQRYGVNTNMFPGGSVTISKDEKYYIYNGTDYEKNAESVSKIVSLARSEWESSLVNKINSYYTAGITVRF